VPTDGPVGQLLLATGRHPWRPAHVHFLIRAAGHETLVTHIFRDGSDHLDSDVVFGVRSSLVADMPVQANGRHALRHTFVLNPVSAVAP
jgi:hydroxyquinol 1,2-dioxygenase